MRHRRSHIPVLPAPHNAAHDGGFPALLGCNPAGQLLREPPGYDGFLGNYARNAVHHPKRTIPTIKP